MIGMTCTITGLNGNLFAQSGKSVVTRHIVNSIHHAGIMHIHTRITIGNPCFVVIEHISSLTNHTAQTIETTGLNEDISFGIALVNGKGVNSIAD